MIRGLYTASNSLVVQSIKQDITANNLANASTPGFKRSRAVTSSFAQTLQNNVKTINDGKMPKYPGDSVAQASQFVQDVQDESQGALVATSNALDFAINGPGTFTIQTANGNINTRAGSFVVNKDGELSTQDGGIVLGEQGAIKLPKEPWELGSDGSILVNGRAVDKLVINGADSKTTSVQQGFIESSNVSIVKEMVAMISNMRNFESNQKVVGAIDETLGKLIEVAKI